MECQVRSYDDKRMMSIEVYWKVVSLGETE